MKTLITTFAIAVMVFAFNANPVMANESNNIKDEDCWIWKQENGRRVCEREYFQSQINEIDDPVEKDIADSGNEGSTSAASANDQ